MRFSLSPIDFHMQTAALYLMAHSQTRFHVYNLVIFLYYEMKVFLLCFLIHESNSHLLRCYTLSYFLFRSFSSLLCCIVVQ